MPDVGKSFETLPIHHLICAPILAVADGQAELCRVYLDNLFKIAFKDYDGGDTAEAKVIKFTLNRTILKPDGTTDVQPVEVQAPLLSLIPVPAFTMDEATVRFTMEVKEVQAEKSESSSEASNDVSASYFGIKASVHGKITASSEHTRNSDHSAKYEIYARAVQQQPAEGMSKLTGIFASVIEPISTTVQQT